MSLAADLHVSMLPLLLLHVPVAATTPSLCVPRTWPMHLLRRNSRDSQANGSSLLLPSRLPCTCGIVTSGLLSSSSGCSSRMICIHLSLSAGPLLLLACPAAASNKTERARTSFGAMSDDSVMRFSGGGPCLAVPTMTSVSPEGTSLTTPRSQPVDPAISWPRSLAAQRRWGGSGERPIRGEWGGGGATICLDEMVAGQQKHAQCFCLFCCHAFVHHLNRRPDPKPTRPLSEFLPAPPPPNNKTMRHPHTHGLTQEAASSMGPGHGWCARAWLPRPRCAGQSTMAVAAEEKSTDGTGPTSAAALHLFLCKWPLLFNACMQWDVELPTDTPCMLCSSQKMYT